MFQGLTQGSVISILYRNVPRIVDGRIVSVNTHMPQFNPQQPMSIMNGPVTDITVQVDNETIPFVGLPANGVVANFQDKGMFISTDRATVLREVDSIVSAYRQDLASVPEKERMLKAYESLQLEQNPDRKLEAQRAQEITELKNEISELRKLFVASAKNINQD